MFKQEGYDLKGAVFEVYNELGYGMAEEIYQSAQSEPMGTLIFTNRARMKKAVQTDGSTTTIGA